MPDIKALLAKARPRERTVKIMLDGATAGEIGRLEADLLDTSEDWQPSDLADEHPGRALASQIAELRQKARESEADFRFRYIGDEEYSSLLAAHPSTSKEELFDSDSFPRALIAASCIDPVMTEDQAKELFKVINQGQIQRLFDAAWDVHNAAGLVPFSLAASALLAAVGGDEK
ncbi:hypothetical protein ACFWNG_03820 [Streptomyces sp. NPDC058391]|uniref:hypothetical protein n=1 Tax=Streptomyces sp. NPDC058391 TaxID=3346476 RepID=UPI00366201B1